MTQALLIINLGSPDSPTVPAVRSYLKEFLMDPYVINMPYIFRYALVHGVILPFRPQKTLHAYQSIWTQDGSPLIINTQKFTKKISDYTKLPAEFAMRYGNPNFLTALRKLREKNLSKIKVFLMYPQFALSTTKTAKILLEKLNQSEFQNYFEFDYIQDFHSNMGFIQSAAKKIKNKLSPQSHVFLSFHGLPWSHLGKAVNATNCGTNTCCDTLSEKNQNCYRAQCFQTARLIAKELQLNSHQWSIGFQSRLTRGWIEPFTDIKTKELAEKGILDIVMACPSFTADCLETLEEIQIREKEAFLSYGGKRFEYAECVNDDELFVQAMAQLVTSTNTIT